MVDNIMKKIKKYWYMVLIFLLTALVIVVSFIENAKVAGLTNVIKKIADSYRKQFDKLETLNDKKIKKDKEVISKSEKKAVEIELKKEKQLEEIIANKQKQVEVLKDESAEELAKKLKEEFKL